MNIAFLILAHNNAAHLSRLIDALNSEQAVFFIHIDKKSDLSEFQTIAKSNAFFCENRVNGTWGDFSLVQATLNLMEMALSHSIKPDYLVLLSGSCYPLQPVEYIEQFLEKNKGREFIEAFPMPNVQYGKPIQRLTQFWIRKSRPLLSLKWKLQLLLLNKLPARDYKKGLNGLLPYAGSQWWAITFDAANYIQRFMANNPGIKKFYQSTDCPDEGFFQTILANSPFKEKISHSLTYTDWQPGETGPVFITEGHLPALTKSVVIDAQTNNSPQEKKEVLFARKFGPQSSSVLAKLDESIRQKQILLVATDNVT